MHPALQYCVIELLSSLFDLVEAYELPRDCSRGNPFSPLFPMSSRIVWLVRITRTFLSFDTQQYLFPFVLSQALPWAFGYYGNSVAMSLAAFRRSRLYDCETLVRLGLPFVSFNSFLESRSLGRALRMHDLHTLFPCHRFRYATMGALLTTGN
jgi:hypothetical protein